MVFSSLTFICVFLPVVFLLHTLIRPMMAKNALLIVASLVFYSYGEPVYVLLMLVSTLANWLFGRVIGRARQGAGVDETSHAGRGWIALAIVFDLGLLGVFKYAGMAVESINAVSGAGIPVPGIALPIGISFYTFQALSYVIDVYRGQVGACRNYADVLLYIAFFPQLIAGPIVKYHDVASQIRERTATLDDMACGLRRFCVGLGKKVLIANTLAITADSIFAAPLASVNITGAWIGAIAYLLQIYFDFSGYSDMAIGMARMFGFRFRENFDHPYTSSTVKEFWRCWHISLSTWFKEYVYIPLGGNRRGRGRAVLNKLIVFFLCGLWHGAAWTFVAWGLIHGLFLLFEEYVPMHKLPKPIGVVYTLVVVCVAFVLFRAETFEQGGAIIAQMFTGWHFEFACVELTFRQLTPLFLITLPVACVAASSIGPHLVERARKSSPRMLRILQIMSFVGALVLLVFSMLALSSGGYNPFIYFRF